MKEVKTFPDGSFQISILGRQSKFEKKKKRTIIH